MVLDIIELQEENSKKNEEISRINENINFLNNNMTKELHKTLNRLSDGWRKVDTARYHTKLNNNELYYDDPIHGQIAIPSQFYNILKHPLLRRQESLKQLSFAYHTYKTATHTRLSHSLGTAFLAMRAMQIMLAKNKILEGSAYKTIDLKYVERDKLILTAFLVGLLHDLGHGPFGHSLDRYLRYHQENTKLGKPDKIYTYKYLTEYFPDPFKKESGDIFCSVERILNPDSEVRLGLESWESLISDLIDSGLDVDRLDYLARDSHMTAINIAAVNINALVERMIPVKENNRISLAYDESAIPYIENVLFARDSMFISCYECKTKIISERILTKIIQFLKDNMKINIDDMMLLTDDELLNIIYYTTPVDERISDYINALRYEHDYLLIKEIVMPHGDEERQKEMKKGLGPEIISWLDLRTDEKYKECLLEKPSQWERHIATSAGINDNQIIITVPSDEAYLTKELAIKIIVNRDNMYEQLQICDPGVNSIIQELYEALSAVRQRIRIFAAEELPIEKMQRIREYSTGYLTR